MSNKWFICGQDAKFMVNNGIFESTSQIIR